MFSRLIDLDKEIHRIKISKNASFVSHILYADNMLIACRANLQNAKAVGNCLSNYCKWYGQYINRKKSSILFSNNINLGVRKAVRSHLGFMELK